MINANKIVPVTKSDLLSILANACLLCGKTVTALTASKPGVFAISSNPSTDVALCNEPVVSFDFASGSSAATVYFIADYAYEGFKVAGTAVVTEGATVDPNSATLYKATLATGAVTIAACY